MRRPLLQTCFIYILFYYDYDYDYHYHRNYNCYFNVNFLKILNFFRILRFDARKRATLPLFPPYMKGGIIMANKKAGFVLYFDSDPIFSLFTPHQRGELFSALFDYARRICDKEESPEQALTRYPTLDGNTAVAFCCIAKDILRETRKWKQRQQNCQQAALARTQKAQTSTESSYKSGSFNRGSAPAKPKLDDAWNYVT